MPRLADVPSAKARAHGLRFAATPADFKAEWSALESSGAGTLFQSYRWADAWCRNVASARGEQPLIVAGFDPAGVVQLLLPFSIRRQHGLSILGWLGQDHASYNMGLYANAGRQAPRGDQLKDILAAVCRERPEIGLIHLSAQPSQWNGIENPFASLPQQPSASASHVLPIAGSFDSLYERSVSKSTRSTLKRKHKRLSEIDGFTVGVSASADERLELLDVYFEQKARQLAEMGAPNVFAKPEIQAFYRMLWRGDEADGPVHDSAYARIGTRVLATCNGMVHNGRFYLLTASLEEIGELAKFSPGLVLFKEQISGLNAKGVEVYDFGVGDGRHKTMWSPEKLELFETFQPVSSAGWAYGRVRAGASSAKRLIKGNPALYAFAMRVRRAVGGSRGAAEKADEAE